MSCYRRCSCWNKIEWGYGHENFQPLWPYTIWATPPPSLMCGNRINGVTLLHIKKTSKWFVQQLPVVPQMVLTPKPFTTYITAKRSFVRVSSDMDKKIVRFCKVAPTIFTDKFFLFFPENKLNMSHIPVVYQRIYFIFRSINKYFHWRQVEFFSSWIAHRWPHCVDTFYSSSGEMM